MVTIEIDDDVFNHLKSLAEPFIDTPNTVLRRILFLTQKPVVQPINTATSTQTKHSKQIELSSEGFVNSYLRNRYGEQFRTRPPFRTMFESENHLVYFQNFNKISTNNLWYRLSASALTALRTTNKSAVICLTNPAENLIIELPIRDIDEQIAAKAWNKDFLEVNIDPSNLRWRELDWNLERYRFK